MKDLWIILGAIAFLVVASLTIGSVNAAEVVEPVARTVTLETKAVELLGKAEQGVEALSEKIQALATAHGGEAWEMGKTVARIDAASHLIPGIICLILALMSSFLLWKSFKRFYDPDAYSSTDICFLHGLLCIVPGTLITVTIASFSNVWAWIGMFEPTIWMAKVALGL